MKKILLLHNLITFVDDKDYEKAMEYNWYASFSKSNNSYYVKAPIYKNGKRTSIFLHRFLCNPTKELVVDHINHNTLDNRQKNLRVCTRSQNSRNYIKPRNNTTGKKGVKWNKKLNKFEARIISDKKYYHLGVFKTLDSASTAYNNAALKLHKQFALIN